MPETEIPEDCRYSSEDEWARAEEHHVAVGITDYAQEQLGDVVYVELPDVGDRIIKGSTFGVIESVKAVADLYAPISGQVARINELLVDKPEWVNEDCYGEGWLIRVEAADPGELESLMDAERYAAYLSERDD